MTDETFRPIIHGQADLEDAWRTLMEPLGFSRRSLWLMFIDADDRAMPQLTEIEDLPLDARRRGAARARAAALALP